MCILSALGLMKGWRIRLKLKQLDNIESNKKGAIVSDGKTWSPLFGVFGKMDVTDIIVYYYISDMRVKIEPTNRRLNYSGE